MFEALDLTLRTNFNITSTPDWYTDDSVKLLQQEFYTLDEAKWLNITSQWVINEVEVAGLNTWNCINGMILTGDDNFQVSYVTNRVFGCHKVSNTSYEFLI